MKKYLTSAILIGFLLSLNAQPVLADSTWLPSNYYQTNISPSVSLPSDFVTRVSPKLGTTKFILVTKLGDEANPTGIYSQPIADRWLNKYGSSLPKGYTLFTFVQNPFDASRGSIYVVVDKSLRSSLTSQYLTDNVVKPTVSQYFKTIPQRPTEGFLSMIDSVDQKISSDIWWNDWWTVFWDKVFIVGVSVVTFGSLYGVSFVILTKLEANKARLIKFKKVTSDLSALFEVVHSLYSYVTADTYQGETESHVTKIVAYYDKVVQEYSAFIDKPTLEVAEDILTKFQVSKLDFESFLKFNDEAVELFRSLPVVEGDENSFVFDNSKDPVKNKRLLVEEKRRREDLIAQQRIFKQQVSYAKGDLFEVIADYERAVFSSYLFSPNEDLSDKRANLNRYASCYESFDDSSLVISYLAEVKDQLANDEYYQRYLSVIRLKKKCDELSHKLNNILATSYFEGKYALIKEALSLEYQAIVLQGINYGEYFTNLSQFDYIVRVKLTNPYENYKRKKTADNNSEYSSNQKSSKTTNIYNSNVTESYSTQTRQADSSHRRKVNGDSTEDYYSSSNSSSDGGGSSWSDSSSSSGGGDNDSGGDSGGGGDSW